MATRTVTFTIKKPDGTAWANARVRFALSPGSYDDEASYLAATVSATTDENGEGSVDLWTNESGEEASEYIVTFPNGETDRFSVPAGSGDLDLTALRLLGVTEAQGSTLITFILDMWKGDWDNGTAYSKGDKVHHDGSAYIAEADTTAGQEPGVHASWGLIAQKGDTGDTGPQGEKGEANDTYDVTGMIEGVPDGSEVILRFVAVRGFSFPAALANSKAVAGTAATAQTVFSVKKDGVEFGTMTFAAAGTEATFASASGATFAAGNVLTVVAPSSQDSTLADIALTLRGTTTG